MDFKILTKILRNNHIEIWADLGCLLGFMREGKLLDNEEDIDVGTLHTREDFKRIEMFLEMFGWKCIDKYKGLAIQNGKTKVDIKFYTETDDSVYAYFVVYKHRWILPICDFLIWNLSLYEPEDKYETNIPLVMLKLCFNMCKLIPLNIRKALVNIIEKVYYNYGLTGHKISFKRALIMPLCVKVVDDFPFRIPAQPKKLLELMYGKNWKSPQKIIKNTDRYPDGSSRYLTIRIKEAKPDIVEAVKY